MILIWFFYVIMYRNALSLNFLLSCSYFQVTKRAETKYFNAICNPWQRRKNPGKPELSSQSVCAPISQENLWTFLSICHPQPNSTNRARGAHFLRPFSWYTRVVVFFRIISIASPAGKIWSSARFCSFFFLLLFFPPPFVDDITVGGVEGWAVVNAFSARPSTQWQLALCWLCEEYTNTTPTRTTTTKQKWKPRELVPGKEQKKTYIPTQPPPPQYI